MGKKSLLIAVFAVLLLGLVACVPVAAPTAAPGATATPAVKATPTPAAPVAAQPKYGGTLLFGLDAGVKTLDPVWTTAGVTDRNGRQMWDTLFAHDSKLNVKPLMVESWKISADLKTYTLTIRSGLTFHDGRPVTTDDVIPSIKRWGARIAVGVTLFRLTESLDKVDNLTFTWKFKDPFGLLVDYLATSPFIMPKELGVQPADQRLETTTWIGSGPFKFVNWREGDRIVLEKYKDYKPRSEPFDGLSGARIVYVDRVEEREVPDPATRVAAAEVGELDIAYFIPPDYYPRLKTKTNIQLQLTPGLEGAIVFFNNVNPPSNNKKFRQALLSVYNMAEAMKQAYGDESLYSLCPGIFFCNTKWDSKVSGELYNQNNVEKGRKLIKEFMAETGWKGKVTLLDQTDYKHIHGMALVTLRDLQEKLQLDVDYQLSDWATLVTKRAQKTGWNIAHTTWGFTAAWDPFVAGWAAPTWFTYWESKDFQDVQREFAIAKDDAGRMAAVEKAQRIVYEEVPIIWAGTGTLVSVLAKHVRGFDITWPGAYPHFWNVWLDK